MIHNNLVNDKVEMEIIHDILVLDSIMFHGVFMMLIGNVKMMDEAILTIIIR